MQSLYEAELQLKIAYSNAFIRTELNIFPVTPSHYTGVCTKDHHNLPLLTTFFLFFFFFALFVVFLCFLPQFDIIAAFGGAWFFVPATLVFFMLLSGIVYEKVYKRTNQLRRVSFFT